MKNITAYFVSALFCLASCSGYDAALEEKLLELDALVENSDRYIQAFEARQDSLKAVYAAATTDSLRWETAYTIEREYRFFDANAAAVWIQKMYADAGDDPRRKLISAACEVLILNMVGNYAAAEEIFSSLDIPPQMDYQMEQTYFTAGYTLYNCRLQEFQAKHGYGALRDSLMLDLIRRDPSSEYSLGRQGRWFMDSDRLDDAQRVLEEVLSLDLATNRRSTREYYLGRVYKKRGDVRNMRYHWAISAIYAFKAPEREYHALYHLARDLYKSGDRERATRYMDRTLMDASWYKFDERLIRASKTSVFMGQEAATMSRQKRNMFLVILFLLLLLLASLLKIWLGSRRYTASLSQANRRLKDANAIKENFLARYMELSSGYIGKVDELCSHLRRTAKEKGVEEMMVQLRKASHADEEYADFYAAFDEIILKMYPDFIGKVNALLEDGHHQSVAADGSLSTELRILALVRLGITDSQKIAGILNMAVSTIYSYRYRLRKWALCPPEEFEGKIGSIDL